MKSTIELIQLAGSRVWRPRKTISLSEWCEEHIRLSPDWEATPGRYNLRDNPFWREPLDAFLDPEVRQISVMKSTQVGGTMLLIAATLGLSELDPAPSMVVGPDEDYCKELRDRIYATGSESPALRDRIPPNRLRNFRQIDLGTARSYLAWAGSPQRLRGRPCKRVLRSEIDVYPVATPRGGNTLKASGERVKRFPDSTIYDESSPDSEDSRIAEAYDAGHRARWMCRCPHCGTYQEMRFFPFTDGTHKGCGGVMGLTDADGNFLAPEIALKTAHYVCIEGCRIEQEEKNPMVLDGMWVAEGQSIEDGKLIGQPSRGRRHLSYHIWSIHSPTLSLGTIAAAYLEHRRDSMIRDFIQNWLGRRYESRKRLPEWHVLGKRLQMEYPRGTIYPGAWFLTAGCDVQADGCYYVIRAWTDQATSYLVDHGYVQRYDTGDVDFDSLPEEELNNIFRSDLRQLIEAVVRRHFPMADGLPNPLGRTRLRPRIITIDSQHRTREVHAFVSSQDEARVRAVRGDHKTKPSDRFRTSIIEKPQRDGPSYASPRTVVNIFTPHYKEALYERFMRPAGQPGSWNLFHNIVQTSADYLRQLTNERPIEVLDERTGRKQTRWKPRSESWGNHYWDAEVYAFCGAEMLLHEQGRTWDASTWGGPIKKRRNPGVEDAAPLAAVRDDQIM